MTKPTTYPDFAMVDTVDPTSGQINVVEPGTEKKDVGWVYNEKPPRQYFNWLSRLQSLWIRWLDENDGTLAAAITELSTVKLTGTILNNAATQFINLPLGFTVDNTSVFAAKLEYPGGGAYVLNHNVTGTGFYLDLTYDLTNHQIVITPLFSSAPGNLNYVIHVRRDDL